MKALSLSNACWGERRHLLRYWPDFFIRTSTHVGMQYITREALGQWLSVVGCSKVCHWRSLLHVPSPDFLPFLFQPLINIRGPLVLLPNLFQTRYYQDYEQTRQLPNPTLLPPFCFRGIHQVFRAGRGRVITNVCPHFRPTSCFDFLLRR